MTGTELLQLFFHFALLSLVAVGGAIGTAPDMQRFVVHERGWMSEVDFTTSVALGQAAPGPNVLFVAVIGWNVGGAAGVAAAMTGTLLPSCLLAIGAHRYGRARRDTNPVRAFTQGMAPITIGLLLASGWILLEPMVLHPGAVLLALGAAAMMLWTRLGPLPPIALGALVGAFGGAG